MSLSTEVWLILGLAAAAGICVWFWLYYQGLRLPGRKDVQALLRGKADALAWIGCMGFFVGIGIVLGFFTGNPI